MMTMKLLWYEGELSVLTRNTVIDVLIRKYDRQERFWAWVDRVLSFKRRAA